MTKKSLDKKTLISNWQKILLVMLMTAYFFFGYFAIASMSEERYSYASIFIDDLIPFEPFFIIFYLIGSALVIVPVFFINRKKEFYYLMMSYFIMLTISFAIFLTTPIQILRPVPIGDDIFSTLTRAQQQLDPPLNTFPSLHIALDLFAFLIIRSKNKKLGNYTIPLLIMIMLSVLFTKQHNFVDVIGGIILGSFAYWFFKRKTSYVSSIAK